MEEEEEEEEEVTYAKTLDLATWFCTLEKARISFAETM
jgi:hypothetical protein